MTKEKLAVLKTAYLLAGSQGHAPDVRQLIDDYEVLAEFFERIKLGRHCGMRGCPAHIQSMVKAIEHGFPLGECAGHVTEGPVDATPTIATD